MKPATAARETATAVMKPATAAQNGDRRVECRRHREAKPLDGDRRSWTATAGVGRRPPWMSGDCRDQAGNRRMRGSARRGAGVGRRGLVVGRKLTSWLP